ncbi:MAG: metallophosphoesterase [Desulfovibrio sp.]|nr:metallophosphoesterase [Desulfovibrio sp.]
MDNVLIVGDVHREWAFLASLLLYYRPDVSIVVGDFGWWPGLGPLPQEALPKEVLEHTRIHFVDGNHENHMDLLRVAPRGHFEAVEMAPGITYQPRGSTMRLSDGRLILFAGGGKSIDWRIRNKGKTWFPEELLRRSHLPKKLPKADIIISHTVPNLFGEDKLKGFTYFDHKLDFGPDPSQAALDAVLEECRPSLWIAGHFHRRIDGSHKNTEYHILDMVQGGLCRPEGMPCTFWLEGCVKMREGPGWALPDGDFIPLVENASRLYACADMEKLSPKCYALFDKRRHMYRTQKVEGIKGLVPREADSFLQTLCRFGWNPEAAMGDRTKDTA